MKKETYKCKRLHYTKRKKKSESETFKWLLKTEKILCSCLYVWFFLPIVFCGLTEQKSDENCSFFHTIEIKLFGCIINQKVFIYLLNLSSWNTLIFVCLGFEDPHKGENTKSADRCCGWLLSIAELWGLIEIHLAQHHCEIRHEASQLVCKEAE